LDFQQTTDKTPRFLMVPFDMGFLTVGEEHLDVTFSVHGFINVNCDLKYPSATFEANAVFNYQAIRFFFNFSSMP